MIGAVRPPGKWNFSWVWIPLGREIYVPFTLSEKNLKTEVSLWKRIKCFPSMVLRRNLKTQQSLVILDLCLRKTRSGKSRDYRDVIVFAKLRFQNGFHCHMVFLVAFYIGCSLYTELCSSLNYGWLQNEKPHVVFQFLRFEERFRKAPFPWRISVDRRLSRGNK